MTAPSRTPVPRRRLLGWRDVSLLTALTVVPLALGGRGRLNADTKQYLYLDPGELLDRARHLWDPGLGGGTVGHQSIGYLWPMGPYYWTADAAGVPDWLAQRLWVGGLQLAAALGALALLRHLMPRHPAQLVGASLYGLSPVVLGHVTGQSGLLLPFAALGWLALCAVLALERGGWRWPAAFALVVTTCGSLNGSSVFFALLGAVLWLPHSVLVTRTATPRTALATLAKLAGLTLVTQLWWLVAYAVGGSYGLPILAVTENLRTTNETTSAVEVLRGLGYWFFYGRDRLGPWLGGLAPPYLTPALVVVTVAVPVGALALGALARWAHRAYFSALVVVGTVVAVGAFPEPGSPFGSLFERLSRGSDLVLSLRNTQRAAPLVVLGLAGLAAAGGAALQRRRARAGAAALAALSVAVAAAIPGQWRTGLIAERFQREEVPAAWLEAAASLDARGDGRVLELPGIDFASYRWGHTLDPVLPGLSDRDVLYRELVPAGGAAGASRLGALDAAMQEYTLEPQAIGPVARMLGAGDVVFRGDLEYERYRSARPEAAWALLTDPDAGLGPPEVFGPGYRNEADARRPMIDELELGLPAGVDPPPQVAILPVPGGGRARLSTRTAQRPTVLAGDGDGVVAAAAAGLLEDGAGPLLLAGDTGGTRPERAGARYVVTDTNRKRAGRWYALRENVGATEPADTGVVTDDPSDARLDVTAGAGTDFRSVVEWRGAERIWANSYGNEFTLLPEDRPSNAFDGDPLTAWRLDMAGRDDRPRLGVRLTREASADRVVLVPVTNRPGTTGPRRVRVALDGDRHFEARAPSPGSPVTVALDGRPFRTLEVEVVEWETGGPVGIAELVIPGVSIREVVRLPTATLDALGDTTAGTPLAIVLSRHRTNPAEVVRFDPEPSMARVFELAGPARLRLHGTARISARARDETVDRAAGLPVAGGGGWTATSSERLAGDLASRAAAAFDGDAATAWTTPFVGVAGQWVEIDTGSTRTLDSFDAELVLDDRHSAPRSVRVSADGGSPVTISLPPGESNPVIALPAPLQGRTFRVEIGDVEQRTVVDWYSERPVALPAAIAEIRIPGVGTRPLPEQVDGACREDLVRVDGRPVLVRLTGGASAALGGAPLGLAACGPELDLAPGRHELETARGIDTAVDVDRLVLTTPAWADPAPPSPAPPPVAVGSVSATAASGSVASDGSPFWVLLDQSDNRGWHLDVAGARVEGPYPVDSFGAGWLVTPERPGRLDLDVEWRPQRGADLALGASAAGVLVCLALLAVGRGRQREASCDCPCVEAAPAPAGGWCRPFVTALVAGAAAAVFVHPLAAAPALVLAYAAGRRPDIGRFVPAALLAVAGLVVAFDQAAGDHLLDRDWPRRFGAAHVVAMLAIVTSAAVAAGDAWRTRAEHVEDR
ncbi:MAG TPA: alpha-(1-_3)-arabinofuranosyltransferase family protein [Acidimicrobiales bacterium]|nr:alpha-(1->3)-arabinofuranosyltransferase family protein [Acidimicrobiales bacterium]